MFKLLTTAGFVTWSLFVHCDTRLSNRLSHCPAHTLPASLRSHTWCFVDILFTKTAVVRTSSFCHEDYFWKTLGTDCPRTRNLLNWTEYLNHGLLGRHGMWKVIELDILQAWKSYAPCKIDCGLFYLGDCDCELWLDVHHYIALETCGACRAVHLYRRCQYFLWQIYYFNQNFHVFRFLWLCIVSKVWREKKTSKTQQLDVYY